MSEAEMVKSLVDEINAEHTLDHLNSALNMASQKDYTALAHAELIELQNRARDAMVHLYRCKEINNKAGIPGLVKR